MTMHACRSCKKDVSDEARTCPHCGAPFPANQRWDGYGFEYKSKLRLFGTPVLHVSFKYRANRKPVPACGIIAIGQYGMGVLTIAQFGIGVLSISQFTIAGYAIAQFGVYLQEGRGQFVWKLTELLTGS